MRSALPGSGSLPEGRDGPPGAEEQPGLNHTALRLLRECGALQAGKAARLEQRRARRARSRRNYAFWTAVAMELEKLAKEPDPLGAMGAEPAQEAGKSEWRERQ
jgi:hypothetical protein